MSDHAPRPTPRHVYGTDHDDPDPGPQPGRTYVELVGGALDGQLLDVSGLTEAERAEGAYLITEVGLYGEGGRADYVPRPGDPGRWDWRGDVP
ncbi:hypothetical protein AB0D16_40920 [Streptomyces sp. NPDC048161]|uniref:hypothetical protein n=1 Tax=Streptomyces sp. NPDC048161 TaxID=3160985 RepID=UPI003411B787